MIENKGKQRKIELVSSKALNSSSKALRFRFVTPGESKYFGFMPGQFFMISVLGYGEIPLTITTSPTELPEFEIAVRGVGNGSKALNRMNPGEIAYIRGPLGNSANMHQIYGRELILVAGGIGLAPLRSIIHNVRENLSLVSKLIIVVGAKTPDDLIFKEELSKWSDFAETYITVDSADSEWTGYRGRIPKILETLKVDKKAYVIMCGPPIMYKSSSEILVKKGINPENIGLMLERRMKCGIGKCQHCTCGDKYVCIDGPTLTWKELQTNWEGFR
jgi:sulfhydrogenase subunit gamma (sulfur reductase)